MLSADMLQNFLTWVSDRRPCRIINGPDDEPYLERYYLFGVRGWHCYLHRFVASDPDRGVHDHPWDRAVSLILIGGYNELRLLGDDAGHGGHTVSTRQRPWRLNRLRGRDFHRVLLAPGEQAWTLFCHGPRVKGWGFMIDGEYIAYARDAGEFRHRDWWLTAPTGRTVRRQLSPR